MIECTVLVPKKTTAARVGLHEYQLVCTPSVSRPDKGSVYAYVVTRNRNMAPVSGFFDNENDAFHAFQTMWLPALRAQEF